MLLPVSLLNSDISLILYAVKDLKFIFVYGQNEHCNHYYIQLSILLVLGGLETESDYKYDGADEKCTFNRTDVRVFINDSISISSNESGNSI
jgi:hypothetical protein